MKLHLSEHISKPVISTEDINTNQKKEFTIEEAITALPALANYDADEVLMGIKDEQIHSDDLTTISKVVEDHLKEYPYWYTVVSAALEAAIKVFNKSQKKD